MLAGPQRHNMLVGGSRSGKTFQLVKASAVRAMRAPESRHVIFRLRFNAVRQSIGMDTLPKVMRLRFPDYTSWRYNKTDHFVTFPNKLRPKRDAAELWLAGLDDKERVERVLGKEYATLYFNECSQIPYYAVTTALTRLAQKAEYTDPSGASRILTNRAYFDLNPVGTGHWSYRLFLEHRNPDGLQAIADPEDYRFMYMNPADNAENLDPKYIASLQALPEKQRRRFLDGRYVAQLDGALWTLEMIEGLRYTPGLTCEAELRSLGDPRIPHFQRIVVSVDPSGASSEFDLRKDEIGIVVAAMGTDGHVYLLEDLTGLYSPEGWGNVAVQAYLRWQADCVVAEDNFGGDMVRSVIQGARIDGRPVGQSVPVKKVTASRGKSVRAEPIAAMYERGMVHHVGQFPQLEEEQTNFSNAGYIAPGSPNRADAFVWAATMLFGKALAYGLTDYLATKQQEINQEQVDRMKRAAERLAPASVVPADSVAKLDTVPENGKQPTEGCPKCGAMCIAQVSSGGSRCSMCAHQWGGDAAVIAPQNRTTLFKNGGRG